MTPPALDRVVKRCLAREPDNRWQTVRDLHQELNWIAEGSSQKNVAPFSVGEKEPGKRWLGNLTWGIASLLLAAMAGLAFGT